MNCTWALGAMASGSEPFTDEGGWWIYSRQHRTWPAGLLTVLDEHTDRADHFSCRASHGTDRE